MAIIDALCTKVRSLNYRKEAEWDEKFVYVYDCYVGGSKCLTLIRPIEEKDVVMRQMGLFNRNFSKVPSLVKGHEFADERTMGYIRAWREANGKA